MLHLIKYLLGYKFANAITKHRIDNIDSSKIQHDINNIIKMSDIAPSMITSFLYLTFDIVLAFSNIALTYYLISSDIVNKWLYFPFFAYLQGTIMTGLWVIGHECGHGAFSKYKLMNDIVGYIVHTALLVPYFSWQYTHAKHHKFTNHLIYGETHVPMTKKSHGKIYAKFDNMLGDDAFAFLQMIEHGMIGWPLYLLYNVTGGKVDAECKNKLDKNRNKSHFIPNQIFPKKIHGKIIASTLGIVCVIIILYHLSNVFGFVNIFYFYLAPYVVTNCWLVMYTYMQHTHTELAHFGQNSDYTWIKGALSTIDRRYNVMTNFLHHNIGSTHILHHINYRIPFYKAKHVNEKIKKYLIEENLYNYDDTPVLFAYFNTLKACKYVDTMEGVQYFAH